MTVRTDVLIDWTVSPRLITVEAPSTTITIQDLVDTLRELESGLPAMNDKAILSAGGKERLTATKYVGVTATLLNAQLTFEDRAGPAFETCTVTDGNLVAVDAGGSLIDAVAPSAYTWVRQELDVSPGLNVVEVLLDPSPPLLKIKFKDSLGVVRTGVVSDFT